MDKDRNGRGWRRWVRGAANERRLHERVYNEAIELFEQSNPSINKSAVDRSTIVSQELPTDENLMQSAYRSLANGATKFMNDFLMLSVNNAKYEVEKETFKEQDLDLVLRYVDLISKKNDLEKQLSTRGLLSDHELTKITGELNKINKEASQLSDYFLSDGKNSDAIFDIMYNTKNNSFIDRAKTSLRYIAGGTNEDLGRAFMQMLYNFTPSGQFNRIKGVGKELWLSAKQLYHGISEDKLLPTLGAIERASASMEQDAQPLAEIANAFGRATMSVANSIPGTRAVVNGVNAAYKVINNTEQNFLDTFDDISKKAVLYSDRNSDLHKSAYRGESVTAEDVKRAKEASAEKKKQLMDDFIFEQQAAKAGKVTLYGNTLWSYDPTVDPDWLAEDEEYGNNLSDIVKMPTHVLASTASTANMFKYQLGNMGYEALTGYILKKYGTSALLSGGTGALIKGAMSTTALISGTAAASASREAETGDEAVGAYEERVLLDAKNAGADYNKVQNVVDKFLQLNYPQLMDNPADERLKFGIALGVKTGDSAWDDALQTSRKGLQKLINANNSLALKDYLETIPYLPYTGSVLKNAIKRKIFTERTKSHFVAKGKTPSTEALNRLYEIKGVRQLMAHNYIDPNGVILRGIDKAAGYFIKKDSPKMKKLGLISRDLSMYAVNRIPYAVANSITEGIEEGQQELLKERYRRGEYDNYSKPYSMFDLVEGLSTLTLANGAIGDYFGINYGDLDNDSQNVRKVMNIGYASSMLFSNAQHALTNIPILDADNANLTSLLKNIRTSNAVATMMADNYEKAQDYQHAGIFYEMIKRGATANGISDRLQLMLNGNHDREVTQQMVDDSKMLAENVEFMYHQNWLPKLLGVKKYGADHKLAILEGATKITDLQKGQQLTSKQGKDISNREIGLRWDLERLLDDSASDEEKQLIFNQRPILKHLYDNLDKIYTKYQQQALGKNTSARLNIAKALTNAVRENNNPNGKKDFADRAILTLTKLGLSEQQAREELDIAISEKEKPSDIARRLADVASPITDKKKAFENIVNRYFAYVHEIALSRALNLSKRQLELLQHVRKNTGLGINTDNLRGVVSELELINNDFIKQHRDAGFDPNSENTAFRSDSGYDWVFDGDKEFDQYVDDLMSWYINGALIKPMRTVAAPYMFGSVAASRLRQAVTNNIGNFESDDIIDKTLVPGIRSKYAKLSTEEKRHVSDALFDYLNVHGDLLELREKLLKYGISEEYTDVLATLATSYDIDPIGNLQKWLNNSAKKRKEERELLQKANEEAAKRFILNRLHESESRSRISRRVFIEDALDGAQVEHTEEDIEDLAEREESVLDDGSSDNTGSQELLHGEARENGRRRTDAELAARRRFYHETEQQLAREQERADKKKLKEQGEDVEKPSEGNPGDEGYAGHIDGPQDQSQPDTDEEQDEDIDQQDLDVDSADKNEAYYETGYQDEDVDDEGEFDDEDDTYSDVDEFALEYIDEEESSDFTKDDMDAINSVSDWIVIEDEYLLDLDDAGNITYDGQILKSDQAEYIRTVLLLTDGIDRGWLDQNAIPNGSMTDVQQMRNCNPEYIGNWLANTFFYAVDDRRTQSLCDKDSEGNPIVDQFNGVKLPKEIGTADELSKRLLQDGWLYNLQNKGKVYYIVTLDKGIQSVKRGSDKKDAYTVSLVIEDDDKCFLTFLRDLGKTKYKDEKTGEIKERNSELWWYNWLALKNANVKLINQELGGKLSSDSKVRAGLIIKFVEDKVKEYLRSLYIFRYGDDIGFENYLTGSNVVHNDEFSTTSRLANIKAARRLVRGRYAINNLVLLGEEDIKAQIDKLRELRNDIIRLYTNNTDNVPSKIRTDIVPNRLLQSNGKIDTQKNRAGRPIYRNISEGIDIQEIEKDFNDNALVIGYGKGAAAYGNKFAVQNIKAQPNTNDGIFHGKGLSGKLYMLIKGLTRDSERVPVMLAEEKFNVQTRTKDGKTETRYIGQSGPVAVLDVVNGVVENVSAEDKDGYTYLPSAAEVIFYMLCRRGQFANIATSDKQKSVVDFIVNNGERTLFEKRSGWEKRAKRNDALFNTLTSKLLAWFKDDIGKYGLSIGLPEFDENRKQTIYKLYRFNEEDLFAPDGTTDEEVLKKCRQNRQRCITAIALLMHWNTDLTILNEMFNGDKLGFGLLKSDISLLTLPRELFDNEDEYLQQTYNILGCPELSFNLRDILSGDTGFRNISWLIKNGKIKTDVSPQIFKDPYVFGIGAKKSGKQDKQSEEGDELDNNIGVDNDDLPLVTPPAEPTKQEIKYFTDDVFEMIPSRSKKFVATDEESRKELIKTWNSKYSKSNKYEILDRIAVTRNSVYETDWEEEYADENMLKAVIDEISRTVIDAWKKNHTEYTVSDKINILLDEYDLANLSADQFDMPIVVLFDTSDGKTVNVTVTKHDFGNGANELNSATFFSGVYKLISTMSRTKKSIDENKARKWLFDKLGIRGYNVWVQKGAINGANGKAAYGATTLACDAITGQIVAYFALSKLLGGYGVEYHEAWHYVNLLLHDENYRTAIYDEYVKYHKFAENMSDEEVEELLADDFMKYVLAKQDKSFTGRIKNFFLNIVDLINLVLNRKQYRRIYKNIVSGNYKFTEMNDQSVKDFQNKYGGHVNSLADNLLPLLNEYSYSEVYEAVDSVINQILTDNKAYGVDRIKKLFNDSDYFEKIFKPTIDNMMGSAAEQRIGAQYIQLLEDLKLNQDFIKAHLAQKFTTLGFNIKFKNLVASDLDTRENDPENTWDKLDISSSRKDNASAKIKMFLSTLPAKELITRNDGSVSFVDVKTKFGTTKLFDYDTVWGSVVGRLYDVKNYAELRLQIKRLSKEHRVFNSLELRMRDLDNHNDSELKSQLFGICNSHINHVQTIVVSNPFEKEWEDEYYDGYDDEVSQGSGDFTNEVLDVTKEWALSDDGAYNPGFTLPRNWSQSLASTSFIRYNPETGDVAISKEFVYGDKDRMGIYKMVLTIDALVVKQNKAIKDLLGSDAETVDNQYRRSATAILGKFINLCHTLCIPIDYATIHHMFMESGEFTDSSKSEAQRYYNFITNLVSDTTRGSVRDVVGHIQTAYDESQNYITIEGKQKAFDEIYNNLSLLSQIARFAINYSQVYPKLGEISTRSANGDKIYPVNLNNYTSDRVTEANKRTVEFADDIQKSPYNGHSIIAQEIRKIVPGSAETELRLNTFVGIKQKGGTSGNDYMQMTPMEDYLTKLFLTENDNLVFPTMADKKTWYSLSIGTSSKATKKKIGSASGFDLSHTVIVNHIPQDVITRIATSMYEQLVGEKDKSTGSIRKGNIRKFAKDPKNREIIERIAKKEIANMQGVNFRHFDDVTIKRFRGYMLDEISALKHFYSTSRILAIIDDPSLQVDNYDSDVEDGKMLFGGNGGLFRYLYNVAGYNMNHRLRLLEKGEKRIIDEAAHDDTAKEGDMFQNVSVRDIPLKYAIKNQDGSYTYDGFELIRQYLDKLETDVISEKYDEKLNGWLINKVDQEMLELSNPNSPINLIENKNGKYYPKTIPQHFLQPYFDQLKELGFASSNPLYRVGSTYADEGVQSAVYSLIANHVANSLTSIIEIEKVFSGDPAYYQYKYKGGSTKTTYTHTFESGAKTKVTFDIKDLTDPYSDKIKRLGGLLSPGTNLRLDFHDRFKRKNKGKIEDVDEIELDRRVAQKYFKDEAEVNGHSILGTSKYTIVDANDIKCPSAQLNLIREELKRQVVIDLIHTKKIKYNGSILDLYNNDLKFNSFYESVKEQKLGKGTIFEYVSNEVDTAADPYNDITVADAQVMIRPALYRKIRIGLGDWSKDDERAYWILETDDKWMEDAEKAKTVRKFLQYVLKMSYFDNDFERAPVYNKMAIFPIFKFQRSTDVGEALYNRMNKAGNEIDMIAFKSAIKVGATKDGLLIIDKEAPVEKGTSQLSKLLQLDSNKSLDYSNGEILPNDSKNTISVRVQDLKNLRLQLNTHAHEDLVRAIGTQMFKIGFSNIIDSLPYGERQRTGEEIRKHIMLTINKLTELGVQELHELFYTTDKGQPVIDEDKVRQYMILIVHNNGLGPVAEDIINSGGVASSLQSRKVFEQSISKKVNKDVVDIHTLGGTAIQQSCFGYEAFDSVISDEYVSYNNGKPLTWHKENGTMEVLLSIKFFKSAVPAAFRTDYKKFRQYLINHDIISGVKHSIAAFTYSEKQYEDVVPTEQEGKQNNPKPFGIGYRIPTQGMSSTFVFTVADVLPEQTGDLIIVPREFTAQTGSDFDIDKLFLATLSYKNGELEEYDENEPTKNALSNELLLDYMDIIADKKNFYQSRGSIDTFTEILTGELLPKLRKKQAHYFDGGTQLLPSFQAFRKMEFATGKTGIGPYALNVTNLALTQAARLTMDFVNDEFELGNLYDIYGKDGKMISGWLSAMVNAHVDVAKDPYIFALNVNRATYNMCNFLIRTGNGLASFAFIAQPILKLYAQQKNAKGGIYGKSLDLGSDNPYDGSIGTKLKKRYIADIERLLKQSNNGKVNAKALTLLEQLKKGDENGKKESGKKPAPITGKFLRESMNTSWAEVISLDANIESLENKEKGTPDALIEHDIHQILSLYAFEKLDLYALAMSTLVTASQIDTKKFGNDITQHRVFMNKHYLQRYEANVHWKIDKDDFPEPLTKDGKLDIEARTAMAMEYYFEELFLEKKLRAAINLTKEIASKLLIVATDAFDYIFTKTMLNLYGKKVFVDCTRGSENKVVVGEGWGEVYDKDKPGQIANALDNICRFYALLNLSLYIDTETVDLTVGRSKNALIEKLSELYFGKDDVGSIFQRGADLINKLRTLQKEELRDYRGLVDRNGKITNALLEYLSPMTASQNHELGRFLLKDSSFEVGQDVKSNLRIAWMNLINHPNKTVSDFAKDLILYAYYSKYDQNTPGSFFDIVPQQYRKQYDDALKSAMTVLNGDGTTQDRISQLFGDLNGIDGIMDIMYRNYWYDDNVVTAYNYHDDEFDESKNVDIFDINRNSGVETVMGWYNDTESGAQFPGMVITSKTSLPYFKLRKNNSVFLYKRVGVVNRQNKDVKKANGSPINVYVCTPKAGHKEKNNIQFEFYADKYTDSIFSKNMLPKQFGEDVLKEMLQKRINGYNNSDSKYILTLEWDQIPESRMSDNMSAYIQVQPDDVYFNGEQARATSLVFSNIVDKSGQKAADVIFNIILDQNSPNKDKRVNLKFQEKVIDVQFGERLTDELIQKIKDVIALDEELVDKKHILHFVTGLYDSLFHNLESLPKSVSDKITARISEIMGEHLENYRKQLTEDGVELEKIEILINNRKEQFNPGEKQYNFANAQAGIEIVGEFINTLVLDAISNGIPVNTLTSVASKSNTMVSLGATHAANISLGGLRNTIYCNEGMPQTDRGTYSSLIGRVGRIAKVDKLIVDELLRKNEPKKSDSAIADALQSVENPDVSELKVKELNLEIINDVNNDNEDQNKNCVAKVEELDVEQGRSVSDALSNNLVDTDDDF